MAANRMQAWRWWRGQYTPKETVLEELELSMGIARPNMSQMCQTGRPQVSWMESLECV